MWQHGCGLLRLMPPISDLERKRKTRGGKRKRDGSIVTSQASSHVSSLAPTPNHAFRG